MSDRRKYRDAIHRLGESTDKCTPDHDSESTLSRLKNFLGRTTGKALAGSARWLCIALMLKEPGLMACDNTPKWTADTDKNGSYLPALYVQLVWFYGYIGHHIRTSLGLSELLTSCSHPQGPPRQGRGFSIETNLSAPSAIHACYTPPHANRTSSKIPTYFAFSPAVFTAFSASVTTDLAESAASCSSSLTASRDEPFWLRSHMKIRPTWTTPTHPRKKLTAASLALSAHLLLIRHI